MKSDRLFQGELAQVLVSFRRAFNTVGVFSAVINILMLTPALYMLQLYDSVLSSRNEMTLAMLTLIMLGAYIFMGSLEFVRSFILIRVGAQFDIKLNQRIYTAAFEQNLRQNTDSAGQALQDLSNLRQFLTGNAPSAFFDFPWFPIYLSILFLFSIWLGILAVFGVVVLVLLAYINERLSQKPLAEASNVAITSNALASSNLRNTEVIEAMGMLPNLMARWYKQHSRFLALQAQASEKSGTVTAISKTFSIMMQSFMYGLGTLLVLYDSISPGMMIAGPILFGRAVAPVQLMINIWRQFGSTRRAYERLSRLLEENPARKAGMTLPRPAGKISVENIMAGPPGSKVAVIKGLSFAIEPGEVLGIIGPSGSGKSTLARLLVGVWPAVAGKIRLDGADIYQWNKDELGPHIGYLPQDIELFAGTISENIARFGEIDAEKVVMAARQSGVHEMILAMPQGYDTVLGDGGMGLSGGQKQRIGLARALYGDPSLIVLDEPNSNLDDIGEHALLKTIIDLRKRGKTIIVITHRTRILAATTRLLLLHNGVMKLFGTTEEVRANLAQQQQQQQQARPSSQDKPLQKTGLPASQAVTSASPDN